MDLTISLSIGEFPELINIPPSRVLNSMSNPRPHTAAVNIITSFFGMNFDHMPLVHNKYGLPALYLIFAIIAAGIFLIFKRKKWL